MKIQVSGLSFILLFSNLYIRVCLTLNPVHECVSIAFQWSVGRPVCRCVARRAWSGLESRKSRQRSKTMNSYSANVASEISMRARNAARMLQKFRDAGTGPRVYLHTSYDIIPFFLYIIPNVSFRLSRVCLPAPTNHRPREGRERERGIINRFRFRVRPCKMQSARDVAKLTFNFALDGLE